MCFCVILLQFKKEDSRKSPLTENWTTNRVDCEQFLISARDKKIINSRQIKKKAFLALLSHFVFQSLPHVCLFYELFSLLPKLYRRLTEILCSNFTLISNWVVIAYYPLIFLAFLAQHQQFLVCLLLVGKN